MVHGDYSTNIQVSSKDRVGSLENNELEEVKEEQADESGEDDIDDF